MASLVVVADNMEREVALDSSDTVVLGLKVDSVLDIRKVWEEGVADEAYH